MKIRVLKITLLLQAFIFLSLACFGQDIAPGIFYQAVARDNAGKELASEKIDVKFSIMSGNPLGATVYQELHEKVITSKYGVFSLVIGKGINTGGTSSSLSQIKWSQAYHYLKVEVKFKDDFLDMGTMQFMAVPYALYALKSLEPGPPGPKGDTGDPASDKQTLSFNGSNLAISGGNTVNLSTLSVVHQLAILGDTLSILGGNKVALTNQIQDLQIDVNNKLTITKKSAPTVIDLAPFKQNLSFDATTGMLSISNGTGTDLSALKTIGIQDIRLEGNQLRIDKNPASTGVDLSKYLDNTDKQELTYSEATRNLSISGGNSISMGAIIAFRAGIASTVDLKNNEYADLIFDQTVGAYYTDGTYYNPATGKFKASCDGIFTFNVALNLPASASVAVKLSGTAFETIIVPTVTPGSYRGNITMKLKAGQEVNVAVLQTNGYTIPAYGITGSFSGFRVY